MCKGRKLTLDQFVALLISALHTVARQLSGAGLPYRHRDALRYRPGAGILGIFKETMIITRCQLPPPEGWGFSRRN